VTFNAASGGGSTGVLIKAGIDTSVGDTGGVLGTILVDPALYADTLLVRVSFKPGGTSAGCLVVGGEANGIAGAGISHHTGVYTCSNAIVVDDAHFSVGALGIALASNWYTSYIRVSGVPLRAEADRFMVGHKALGVGSTAARVHTVPIIAGFGLRTLVISSTSN